MFVFLKNRKKIELTIPSVDDFIHKIYINIARKLYTNIYLFERNISPLIMQRNNREFEIIVQNCILNCVRDNIPVDEILKCYLEEQETTVDDIIKENNLVGGKIKTKLEKNEEKIENKMKSILDEREKIENKDSVSKETEEKDNLTIINNNIDEDEDEDIDNEKKSGNFEFKLKDSVKESMDNVGKKSLSFSDTIKAVDSEGGIEEISMDIMDERREERERDLFSGFDDDDEDEDEKLTIIQNNNNEDIKLDFVDL